MTKQEVLDKAIQKAQANGFMTDHKFEHSKDMGWTYVLREKPTQSPGGLTVNVTGMLSEGDIIFNHDFAKALWGEKYPKVELPPQPDYVDIDEEDTYSLGALVPHWQFHLQRMVVADDPIEYLESAL